MAKLIRPEPRNIIVTGSEMGAIGANSNGNAPAVPAKRTTPIMDTNSMIKNLFITFSSLIIRALTHTYSL